MGQLSHNLSPHKTSSTSMKKAQDEFCPKVSYCFVRNSLMRTTCREWAILLPDPETSRVPPSINSTWQ